MEHNMLNRILVPFFIILTTALIAQTTVSPDWNNCTADSSQGIVKLMQSRRYAGAIAVKPKKLADHLKYNFKDGRLEIDTREVFKQPGIKAVILRLRSWKPNTEYLLKNCYLDMSIASTPGGLNATMYFEGNTGANKKHYWKAKKFIAENTPEIIHFEQVLPQDLNGLTLRCDLKQPGIYSIGKVTFGKVKEKKIDAAKNHIVNGGAEREWYNIGTIGAKIMAMWDDNIIYNGTGKTFHKEDKFEIDSKVKHSGRNAFRIRSDQDSTGRFAFNSVPFTPGKPATFAVWLKADKPNTKVRLSMFLGSGIAYVKHINVGTGWKQYTQTVPVFGDKVRGMNRVGDPINGNCAVFRRLTPLIFIKNGTLWIDDATYQQSLKAIPVKSPKLSVSGYLNNKAAYYKSGQKISATLKLLSDNNETVPVSWEVYDFFGKIVSRNNAGNVTLKAGKPQTMIYDLKLSEKLRGPMNWTFILGNVRHNLYFGVIEKSPNRSQRLGINYSSRQNTKVAIPMLKDFGFGSVRLWSAFRKLPFHGFRDTSIFHENDFYVMMCISSLIPVAPSCLVPNDLTEWADLVVKNVKEVKGHVDCYEILNEPNIWNGRHKNPDEKKFREMTPAVNAEIIKFIAKKIRTVDNKVKISGPTSCHTDVSWTASILKNGASKYLDIITEHPYRDQPELPDYAEDLEKMHKLLGRYRSNFPIIASEAGARSIAMPPDNLIIDCMRKASAYNSRMMLIGLANGLKQYHHFCMNMAEVGTGWGMTLAGNLDSDGQSLPAPVMFALRNLVDRIGEGKPAGRVKLGNSYRCYIFDKGKNRVAAVWKWHGALRN